MEYVTTNYIIAVAILCLIAAGVIGFNHFYGGKGLATNAKSMFKSIATLNSKLLFNKGISSSYSVAVFKAENKFVTALFSMKEKDIVLGVSENDPQPVILGKSERLDPSHYLINFEDANAKYILLKGVKVILLEKQMKVKTGDTKL